LHENRKELYIFKQNQEATKKLSISIFPNGKRYEMNGENLYDEGEVLRVLYRLAKDGRIEGF